MSPNKEMMTTAVMSLLKLFWNMINFYILGPILEVTRPISFLLEDLGVRSKLLWDFVSSMWGHLHKEIRTP